jgi:predicted GH43/DUF377 family glycosyl hydrolase
MNLDVRDAGVGLDPDPTRVVADLFLPGERTPGSSSRTEQVLARVMAVPAEQIEAAALSVQRDFAPRHVGLELHVSSNAVKIDPEAVILDDALTLVLGATFTAEFATEGAALCNPSAVPHPDQSGLADGVLRVIVSLRSIGEGHVSAISFAIALIGPGRVWAFEERRLPVARAALSDGEWDVDHLRRCLTHDGQLTEAARAVVQMLPSRPREVDIEAAIRQLPDEYFSHIDSRTRVEQIRVVGRSTYRATFAPSSDLSQRVLLPSADEERQGMEDARFVRFVDDDGSVEYRGSYTAFDGRSIASRLVVTPDFEDFVVHRLIGSAADTKGMAFFPRRVGGRLLALSRSGGEVISLASSDDGLDWHDERVVYVPDQVWEVVQTGNCGSPIETDRGWLVLTHGVGPMRRYCIGAILLDLDDPGRVVARLVDPLLEPEEPRRDGYVPNVVYTCGGIVHDGVLWIPHGVGDSRVRVASVRLPELLDAMTTVAAT